MDFEIITQEEFEGSSLTGDEGRSGLRAMARGDVGTSDEQQRISDLPLTWCDFCKGNYNKYHFGDIDGETQVE